MYELYHTPIQKVNPHTFQTVVLRSSITVVWETSFVGYFSTECFL